MLYHYFICTLAVSSNANLLAPFALRMLARHSRWARLGQDLRLLAAALPGSRPPPVPSRCLEDTSRSTPYGAGAWRGRSTSRNQGQSGLG
jgi:hypothetical protein